MFRWIPFLLLVYLDEMKPSPAQELAPAYSLMITVCQQKYPDI